MRFEITRRITENRSSRDAFWEVWTIGSPELKRALVVTRWGKIGSAGQVKIQFSANSKLMASEMAKEKARRDYHSVDTQEWEAGAIDIVISQFKARTSWPQAEKLQMALNELVNGWDAPETVARVAQQHIADMSPKPDSWGSW